MKPPIKVDTRFICEKMSPECPYFWKATSLCDPFICWNSVVAYNSGGEFIRVCKNRSAQADALYPAGRADD